ncbi:LysM peptidoglycan-binding domain-containing M23 family metallopeptidase [Aquidulcibacter sp.]|uniref:LysM peptidoglycan-binding domain-containing M23 family metallopeptidase n=1 Tax=Aquidulcibacter sp. TaxID=2052990 RepID=UPI0025BD6764|nr:LysM peptidoglycan-binding domain-containing M23 family metallopeptidase [Aquidulcibacter sp.]MCA3693266.1 LysM peptidoglycan-binding domain-containing M23 family metallopeptidase [Aquidulcibacter sp.]
MRRAVSLLLIAALATSGLSPVAAQPAPGMADFDPQNPPTETRVMRGETLYAIAERTRSPLAGLIQVNGLRPPYALAPGQVLKLPPLKVHIVRRNESFAAIARRYSVDERSLALFNRFPRPVKVQPGQKVILPALVRDQLTGLEPQDLVTLLASEMAAGRTVSGAVPGQLRPNLEAGPVAPVTPAPAPPRRPVAEAPKPKPGPSAPAIGPQATPNNLAALPNFIWPVRGRVVETFGTKADLRVVDGIEIEAPAGTPFKAAASGTVAYVGNQLAGYGWLVLIRHSSDYMTAYAFANSVNVREGQTVTRGQVIGQVGQTGRARSPRLHFQVRHATKPVDPVPFLGSNSANPT